MLREPSWVSICQCMQRWWRCCWHRPCLLSRVGGFTPKTAVYVAFTRHLGNKPAGLIVVYQHSLLSALYNLGLHRLTAQQSADLYELILNRHRSSSFVITSNRAVDEWLSLFDNPILGNSALDRLANASYQIVIEGTRYRERLSPHRTLLSNKGGD